MNNPLDKNEEILWQNLINAFLRNVEASSAFFAPGVDRVKLVRQGFRRGNIAATLSIASRLESSELVELLPELVNMSTAQGYARKAREIILSLPHDRLIVSIEEAAEPILLFNDEVDLRQIFHLYLEIDRALAVKLVKRAINHSDEYIREVGQELLETV
jgi:hypothetical protein